jgi:putative redox protein
MPTSKVKYLGNLRTEAIHLKSGEKFITDAPIDNNGKGEAFSPTDLMATSLANCMMTIMGIAARARNTDVVGMHADVTKVMAAEPRRVSEIIIELYWDNAPKDEHLIKILKEAGLKCPVAFSLPPDLKQTIHFHF